VELAILITLAQHGPLAADRIAAQLEDPPGEVQVALRRLRDRGLVDVVAVGELQGHSTNAASYWRLTDAGRERARAAAVLTRRRLESRRRRGGVRREMPRHRPPRSAVNEVQAGAGIVPAALACSSDPTR